MERSQEKFILEQLNAYPICEISEKYTDKVKEVSIQVVRNILNKNFISGSDMKAVHYLFDTIFLSATKKNKREKGLYNLSKHIKQFVTKMEKLHVKSTEGFVYDTDIFSKDIQVVIKIPQLESGFESMIREYFIGIKAINKLQYIIPVFVYTLGSFLCPKPTKTGKIYTNRTNNTAYVLYEKISGEPIGKLLNNKEINFDQWLLIFVQILLGLEVAQREVRFTHFDLHTGNVMVCHNDNFNYTVPLDTTSYNVNNTDLIPVIIDFGLATSYIDDRYIGSFKHARYGMLNFMVPGYDMYKFIIYSVSNSKDPDMKQNIMNLFQFYGDNDPYDILKKGSSGVSKATKEYCREASFSPVANYTPLMFVEWICKIYRHKLQPNITVSERMLYIPIRYSSIIKEYDDIFHYSQEGRYKAIELADECINLKPSYVMTKYNIKVLENYNKGLQSPDIASHIKGLNIFLNASENLLNIDIAMMEKVFEIKIPSQRELKDIVDNILNITIRHPNPENKRKAVKDLDILVYQEKLKPYLQFYFTILEIDLEDRFTEWIQRFKTSDIFQFYTKNVTQNERAIRWGQTLLASIL